MHNFSSDFAVLPKIIRIFAAESDIQNNNCIEKI